jgi:hypothetical protein
LDSIFNKMSEETKTSTEEQKTVSLPDFLNKSFECLFNQNVHLHRALAQVLQEEFKKQEERHVQLEEKIDVLEKNLKEGFLHYTREIIKGLDDTTQALLDTIAPPLHQMPPPILARRSSPVTVMESVLETENEI